MADRAHMLPARMPVQLHSIKFFIPKKILKSMKNGPIILIDDDGDECELLQNSLQKLSITNNLLCFATGPDAIQYLKSTTEQPFLILCDINLPQMNGIEIRKNINADPVLKKKSIPFVFYTTSATKSSVEEAYEMSVQGFFEKGSSSAEITKLVKCIHDYWQYCRHPNN